MEINIPIAGNSVYGYAFDVSLSLDSSHFVYGYGYGDFDGLDPTYFDVLSIDGGGTGYGIESKSGYGYGWGYERTESLAGDDADIIAVTATVTDDGGIPAESGIPVLFTGSPGVSFTSSFVYTDANGEAVTSVRIDSDALRNLDIWGTDNPLGERPRYYTYPPFGYMKIEATIPKCLTARDWDVLINIGGNQSYGESEFQLIGIPTRSFNSYVHFSGDLTGVIDGLSNYHYFYTTTGLIPGLVSYDYDVIEIPDGVSYSKYPWLIYTGENTEMAIHYETDAIADGSEIIWSKNLDTKTETFTTGVKDIQHTFTMYAYGDTRSAPDDQNTVVGVILDDIAENAAQKETILLHTGDWVNDGASDADWNNQFFPLDQANLVELKKKVPIVGCGGNHEINHTTALAGNDSPYRKEGDRFRKFFPYGKHLEGDPFRFFHSFDFGTAHVISLDEYDASINSNDAGIVYDAPTTGDTFSVTDLYSTKLSNGYNLVAYMNVNSDYELRYKIVDEEINVITSEVTLDLNSSPGSVLDVFALNDEKAMIVFTQGTNLMAAIVNGGTTERVFSIFGHSSGVMRAKGCLLSNGNSVFVYVNSDEDILYASIFNSSGNIVVDRTTLYDNGSEVIFPGECLELDNGNILVSYYRASGATFYIESTVIDKDDLSEVVSALSIGNNSVAPVLISVEKFGDGKIMLAYSYSSDSGYFTILSVDGAIISVVETEYSASQNVSTQSLSALPDGDIFLAYIEAAGIDDKYIVFDSTGSHSLDTTPIEYRTSLFSSEISVVTMNSGNIIIWHSDSGNQLVYTIINPVPQYTWLERDLAANDKPWVICLFHNPGYSAFASNHNPREQDSVDIRTYTIPMLAAGGCQLTISGHCHNYSRSIDDTYGMTHITAGGGGAPQNDPRDSGDEAGFPVDYLTLPVTIDLAAVTPPTTGGTYQIYYAEKVLHFCRLDFDESVLTVTVINDSGDTIDTATINAS